MDRPTTVIVVEDEPLIAADIVAKLTSLGYQVPATAADPASAVEVIAQYRPDAILMDVNLRDGSDGIQLAESIRADYNVPIVFLTARSDRMTIDRAKNAEPFGYLVKPAAAHDLAGSIEMACHRHQISNAVRLREVWLETQLESVGEGLIVADHNGLIRFVNSGAALLLARNEEDLLGLPFAEQIPLVHNVTGQPAGDLVRLAVLHGAQPPAAMDIGPYFCLERMGLESIPVVGEISLSRLAGEVMGAVFTFRKAAPMPVGKDVLTDLLTRPPRVTAIPSLLELNSELERLSPRFSRSLSAGCALHVNLSAMPLRIHGDRQLFEEALQALVDRCHASLPVGGTITLTAEPVDFERRLPDASVTAFVRIVVSCSGPMIDRPENPSAAPAGLLIDMDLVRIYTAVSRLKGSLRSHDSSARELCFHLVFPESRPAPRAPGRITPTVLLIEENAQLRTTIVQALENAGYEALAARTPQEVFDWSESIDASIHAFILPEHLYRDDSSGLLDQFLQQRPCTPVLVVTQSCSQPDRWSRLLDRPCDTIDYLYSLTMLREKLDALTGVQKNLEMAGASARIGSNGLRLLRKSRC